MGAAGEREGRKEGMRGGREVKLNTGKRKGVKREGIHGTLPNSLLPQVQVEETAAPKATKREEEKRH